VLFLTFARPHAVSKHTVEIRKKGGQRARQRGRERQSGLLDWRQAAGLAQTGENPFLKEETMSTTVTIRNGINVSRLVKTVEAIKQDPALAKFRFRARSQWQGGGRCQSVIESYYGAGGEQHHAQPHIVNGDEPALLLGQDSGPNAVETVLAALASCLAVGVAYNAAAQGITLEAVEFDSEGDLDLQAFLGLSDSVRPGFDAIRLTYRIKADAPREKLEELCAYVQRTSPVLDIIRNQVPVSIELAE
jgi:uncharacterized OsmC-like protein